MHDAAGPPDDRPRLYEPLGARARLVSTRVRAWVAIATIYAVAGRFVADAVHAGNRADAWRRAVEGTGSVETALQLQRDGETLNKVGWLCIIISAVALVYWSYGIICNAVARGVRGIHRAEAFYWLLPIFGIGLALKPLQHSVRSVGYSEHRLTRWLWVAYIHLFVAMFVTYALLRTTVDIPTIASKLDSLDTQAQIRWIVALWFLLSATVAMLAIRHTDRSVSKI